MTSINEITAALDYIEEQLDNSKLTIAMISDYIGVSESHFGRAFKVLTNYSVSEYIRNRRLSSALSCLQGKFDNSVLDVALSVGYETPEAFSKAFKRYYGVVPSECRDKTLAYFYPFSLSVTLTQRPPIKHHEVYNGPIYLFGDIEYTAYDDVNAATYLWSKCKLNGFLDYCLNHPQCEMLIGMTNNHGYTIKGLSKNPLEETNYVIDSHKWMVFPCANSGTQAIIDLWHYIFTSWIPKNENLIADLPYLEVYQANYQDYTCEIWIPIIS